MTAQELIKAALRIDVKSGQGQTPSDFIMTNCLEALLIMLRSLAVGDMFKVDVDSFTLDGSTSYTIGSGATFDTTRPTKILGGYTRGSGIDVPFKVIGEARYRSLGYKDTAAGDMAYLWYNPAYGSTKFGTVYVYPPASGTLYLHNLKPLAEPTGLTSNVLFPPEYDMAIKFNLAIHISPEFGRTPSATTIKLAKDGLDQLRSYHASLRAEETMLSDLAGMFNRRSRGGYRGQ